MAKQAGCEGYTEVNGTRVNVTDWDFTSETTFEDATDTGDGCFESEIATFTKGTGTLNLVIDDTKMPTANPPNLNAGVQLTNLFLFIGNTSKKINIPTANVLSVNFKSAVKGLVTFTCSFKASGAFTMPV
jgi:hypothetical protein